jgi:hypothetical protein
VLRRWGFMIRWAQPNVRLAAWVESGGRRGRGLGRREGGREKEEVKEEESS